MTGRLRRTVRWRWPLIAAIALPAIVVGIWTVETRPTTAEAVSVVGVSSGSPETSTADLVDLTLGRYAVQLTSSGALTRVAGETGVDGEVLRKAVTVTVSPESPTIAVTVRLPSAGEARTVANAVATNAVRIGDDDPVMDADVLSTAQIQQPGLLSSTRFLEAVLVLAALAVAFGIAYALETVWPRIRSGGEAAAAAGAPVLGSLPVLTTRWRRHAIDDTEVLKSARALRFGYAAHAGRVSPGPVALVGTAPGAGATTVAFLLARTLTDRGDSVLLVDLDLEETGLSRRLQPGEPGQPSGPEGPGLADVLHDPASLRTVARHEGDVAVLPASPMPAADDLVDRHLPDVLKLAEDGWNHVFLDVAALEAGESSEVVVAHASSAVLVVPLGALTSEVEHAVARLRRLDVPIRGVVLNRASRRDAAGGDDPAAAEGEGAGGDA